MSKGNKRAITGAIQHMQSMHSEWIRVQNVTNEKFYVVGSDLKELRLIQDQMASFQCENAQTMISQLQIFKESVNIMRNSGQEFHFRGKMNHNVPVLNSNLSCLHSTLEIFHASFYTFRPNNFTAFAPNANGFLPLSVVPKSTLHNTLCEVVLQESEAGSRPALAIPMGNLMKYYETKLLRQVVSSECGLVFTLAVPFCSQSTVLQVYHAIKISLPDKHNAKASARGCRNWLLSIPITRPRVSSADGS